jgi:plasmid stabilization system protein ParE
MARKVTWTQSAWRDLEEIAEYIAKDSPHYAAAFVLEARDAARSLTRVAERGRTGARDLSALWERERRPRSGNID